MTNDLQQKETTFQPPSLYCLRTWRNIFFCIKKKNNFKVKKYKEKEGINYLHKTYIMPWKEN